MFFSWRPDIICRLRRGGGESGGGGGGGGEHDIPGERRAYHLSSVEYKGRNVEYWQLMNCQRGEVIKILQSLVEDQVNLLCRIQNPPNPPRDREVLER